MAARGTLQPAERLGPYQIVAFVAAGGMGEVYKPRDTRLERLVALKRLASPHNDRFQSEARAISALNHPHICQVYDVGADYLVMEYLDGDAGGSVEPYGDIVQGRSHERRGRCRAMSG